MPNPLFSMLGGNMSSMSGPMGNFAQMMQQFQQVPGEFPGGTRKQRWKKLLQSGKMNQSQLNQIAEYGETISAAYAQIRL